MFWGLIRDDRLGGDAYSPLGPHFYQMQRHPDQRPQNSNGLIQIALDEAGDLPPLDGDFFDMAITTAANPPAPWVGVDRRRWAAHVAALEAGLRQHPVAAVTAARVLRLTEKLDFAAGLEIESMGYSMLLAGMEFQQWLDNRGDHGPDIPTAPMPVRYERQGDVVDLWLDSPDNHNGMTAAMRDALFESLANIADDPSLPELRLRGAGRCFSTGGHLPEFGAARDVAKAHYVRSFRSNALILHQLGDRASVYWHGAVIGSGLEIGAAAAHRYAARDMFAQLPELGMGLMMGAGGCISVARAIGRHRCCWMALSGARVRAQTALAWGLVHDIRPAP